MSERTYTLKLSDGSELRGLRVNGSHLVSLVEVKREDIAGKLRSVEVIGDGSGEVSELEGKHGPMELESIARYSESVHGVADGWYILLRELSEEEYEMKCLRGDVEYIAMKAGVEL